jgi:hypothetical protein
MEEHYTGQNEPDKAEGEEHGLRASHDEVWYLKNITFNGGSYKIITQNLNG